MAPSEAPSASDRPFLIARLSLGFLPRREKNFLCDPSLLSLAGIPISKALGGVSRSSPLLSELGNGYFLLSGTHQGGWYISTSRRLQSEVLNRVWAMFRYRFLPETSTVFMCLGGPGGVDAIHPQPANLSPQSIGTVYEEPPSPGLLRVKRSSCMCRARHHMHS